MEGPQKRSDPRKYLPPIIDIREPFLLSSYGLPLCAKARIITQFAAFPAGLELSRTET
jgi:hypothetical protein